ncbi:conjugal transfer outer membrane protein TraH [Vibrio ichthyoenteri ATCC 700023]|uniref:Conjugal transfer outer membrane protein TraH n=1 Tax=Vibrio ichthyoenteri ATCC 700023 TaxID=870968 RepID=F9S7I4_9VIBR|nr:TrbG/VirB9 family P-type conjugative transfer protein [Vibrio ichthyoenteri]EGU31280.1 conjugal transfer outer membrane protein TraH [Vibrio ichthyoenteri ATCC 700023]
MKIPLFFSTALISFNAASAATPNSQGFDPRVQEVLYNPKTVINVSTSIGRATLIQLQNGESIMSKELSGMGMGDATAWGLSVRGNNIFLKPTAEKPDTNLLIVTDKNRTYSFDLITAKKESLTSYVVKLLYPEPKKKAIRDEKSVPCSDGEQNFKYLKWGDDNLSPQYVWDDGRFTCFKFKNNVELPVLYQKTISGQETLINTHMEKDTLVAHGVANEFRLRLGESVLGVKPFVLAPQGFNYKGTTLKDEKRVVIEHE